MAMQVAAGLPSQQAGPPPHQAALGGTQSSQLKGVLSYIIHPLNLMRWKP